MFASEAVITSVASRARLRYGTIVVVGGGCYGSYYVRQLQRGAEAGAVQWNRLVVVDRDPECRVARDAGGVAGWRRPVIACTEWAAYLDDYLGGACDDPGRSAADAIVPSPLMPHLLFEFIAQRARNRWPDRRVETLAPDAVEELPWQRLDPVAATRYISFAEWLCPVNCIEPASCPKTRGPRDWSLPRALRAHVGRLPDDEAPAGPLLFRCLHRVYGVGMIDAADVVEADRRVADLGTAGSTRVLIGTVSHCHGALGLLSVESTAVAQGGRP